VISEGDIGYIAGIIDGEGCISYKQYMRKRSHNKKAYPTWQIRIEVAMTDKSVLKWISEVLDIGTVTEKRYKSRYAVGWKKQWRWRASHRQAYYVSRLIWPYVHVKIDGVQKIIEHYSKDIIMNGKVVDLKQYREAMSLE
tara:strand:+ start:380 stop:799 length:420 start_codon:yes stop_codon:yes gene_type:complete